MDIRRITTEAMTSEAEDFTTMYRAKLLKESELVNNFLNGLSKERCIALVQYFNSESEKFHKDLIIHAALHAKSCDELLEDLRKEVVHLCKMTTDADKSLDEDADDDEHDDYYDDDDDYSNKRNSYDTDDEVVTTSFAPVRRIMRTLIDNGNGKALFNYSYEFLHTIHDYLEQGLINGTTYHEIDLCTPLLIEAMRNADLPESEKMLWALDGLIGYISYYYIRSSNFEQYLREDHAKEAWSQFADRVIANMYYMSNESHTENEESDAEESDAEESDAENSNKTHNVFLRDYLGKWATTALELADRHAEIIPLCEAEIGKTQNYPRLVKYLIKAKRYDDAIECIRDGIYALHGHNAEYLYTLRKQEMEVRELQNDWASLLVLQADAFVESPSVETYAPCKTTAEKLSCWDGVRSALLEYLEEGFLPWESPDWPFSDKEGSARGKGQDFPMLDSLIHIAMHEDNAADALKWFAKLPQSDSYAYSSIADKVADFLKD